MMKRVQVTWGGILLVFLAVASVGRGQGLEPVEVVVFGSAGVDIVNELAYSEANSRLYVGGTIGGPVDLPGVGGASLSVGHGGDSDALVGEYDLEGGVFTGFVRIGGVLDQLLTVLLPRENGDLMIGGAYKEWTDFDADGSDGFTTASLEASFDPFVLRLNSDLESQWITAPFGELSDYAHTLLPAPDGGAFYTGMFRISLTWQVGTAGELRQETYDDRFDTAFVRFDPDGEIVWAKVLGKAKDDAYTFSTLMPDGGVVLAGFFEESTWIPGGAGLDAELDSEGDRDIVVCRFDSDGNLIWGQGFGGPGRDEALDILSLSSGVLLVGGVHSDGAKFELADGGTRTLTSRGQEDCFVASLDPETGLVLWVRDFGGAGEDALYELAEFSAGAVVAGGFLGDGGVLPGISGSVPGRGGRDGFVGLLSPYTGGFYAHQLIGGPGRDEVIAVGVSPGGEILAGGLYSGSAFFGDGAGVPTASSVGGEDAFLLILQASLPADAGSSWSQYE